VLQGDRLGIVDEVEVPGALGRLTYREVIGRCDGMVTALDSLGIGQGERVAIISPNAAKMLIALFAVMGSGRVFVPINFRLSPAEAQFIVDDAGVSLLLVDPVLDERYATLRAKRRVVMDGVDDAELFAPSEREVHWPDLDERLPATLNYTSGTTSTPKGVVLSHRSHWLNAVTVGWGLGLEESDRYLHTLPIFHVNGWGLPLACAALGVHPARHRRAGDTRPSRARRGVLTVWSCARGIHD
jgi:acyl-CoA synthetase (AMP-forming)/AMP-acid ligase II